MEFETTSNGFFLEVDGENGPTIEWIANEDEVIILLPTRNRHGQQTRQVGPGRQVLCGTHQAACKNESKRLHLSA